jgi:hypothetical protein
MFAVEILRKRVEGIGAHSNWQCFSTRCS